MDFRGMHITILGGGEARLQFKGRNVTNSKFINEQLGL